MPQNFFEVDSEDYSLDSLQGRRIRSLAFPQQVCHQVPLMFLLKLSRFTLVGYFFLNFLKDARLSFIAAAMAGVTKGFFGFTPLINFDGRCLFTTSMKVDRCPG